MKFIIKKVSDWDYQSEIEINTLEELMKFITDCEENIIIYSDLKRITIYDDYIE